MYVLTFSTEYLFLNIAEVCVLLHSYVFLSPLHCDAIPTRPFSFHSKSSLVFQANPKQQKRFQTRPKANLTEIGVTWLCGRFPTFAERSIADCDTRIRQRKLTYFLCYIMYSINSCCSWRFIFTYICFIGCVILFSLSYHYICVCCMPWTCKIKICIKSFLFRCWWIDSIPHNWWSLSAAGASNAPIVSRAKLFTTFLHC